MSHPRAGPGTINAAANCGGPAHSGHEPSVPAPANGHIPPLPPPGALRLSPALAGLGLTRAAAASHGLDVSDQVRGCPV